MGRELTKTMDKVNEDYWHNQWHNDFELHFKMGIEDVTQIKKNENVTIYGDTDSCDPGTIISTDSGKFTIEQWYDKNTVNGSAGSTLNGHESIITNDKILNYKDGDVYFTNVKRIIRHKVSKPKWKLKTKSGKEVIITNDHSMIVFRDGEQIEIKPCEILKSDKILVLKNNIYR